MTLSSQFRALALIALLGALLFGCGDSGDDAGAGSDTSPTARTGQADPDVTYVVTGVTEKGEPRVLVPGSEIRLAFQDGRLGITAGCNSMSGAYRLEGTRLTVESLATTEMGCDQALMTQDAWVAGLFAEPVQLRTGNDAAIISGDVVLALTDREEASPDKPLTGTEWRLDSIGEGGADGAVSSIPQGVTASFTIGSDGAVEVFDGCNGGSGPVTVAGSTITWADRVQTLRGCSGASEEVARTVGEVLSGATTFTVEEKTLTITKGDRFLGFRAD